MKHWKVQIDWFDDGKRVMSAETDTDVVEGDTAFDALKMLADICTTAGTAGSTVLRRDGRSWDRRTTHVCLTCDKRSRSITIDQRANVTDEEAMLWSNQMVDWILAAETTELLEA